MKTKISRFTRYTCFILVLFLISSCATSAGPASITTAPPCPTCAPPSYPTQALIPTHEPESTATSSPVSADTSEIIVIFPKQIIEDHSEEYYTLDLEYPYMLQANTPIDPFNSMVDELVSNESDAFIQYARDDIEFIKEHMPEAKSSLIINQSIKGVVGHTVSVYFQVSYYIVGAAHGTHYSKCINYDIDSGEQLTLADVFKPQSNYLKILSDKSIESLIGNDYISNDTEWLKTGAAAKEENFQNWNLTEDGILITFDPYQVAPYAAGFQEVLIPYSDIAEILNENGPFRNNMP